MVFQNCFAIVQRQRQAPHLSVATDQPCLDRRWRRAVADVVIAAHAHERYVDANGGQRESERFNLAALRVGRRGPRVNEIAAHDDEARRGTHV